MSTIKSSAENLTLNADGANNDIKFQSNGSEVASIDQAGTVTATSFAGSGANLTGVGVDGIVSNANATAITIASNETVTLNALGGNGYNDAASKVLKTAGTQHTIVSVETSSTGGHQAALELESNGNPVVIATSGDDKMHFTTNAATRMTIAADGKVGIGTTSNTLGKVTVFQADNFSTASTSTGDNLYLTSDATSGDNVYGASIAFSRVQYPDRRGAAIASVQKGSDEDNVGLAFFTHPSSNASDPIVEAMRIDSNGYVTMPYQPIATSAWSGGVVAGNIIPASSIKTNVGSHLAANGKFTAPVAGIYWYAFTGMKNTANYDFYVTIKKNGATLGVDLAAYSNTAQYERGTNFGYISLGVNDYLEFEVPGGHDNLHGQYGSINFALVA